MKKGPIYENFGVFSKFFEMTHSMCAHDLRMVFEIFGDVKADVTPFQSESEVISIVGGSRWCLKFLRKIFARISGSIVWHSLEKFRESGAN